LAFLDSDDDWHPQKIEIQIALMEKHNKLISGTAHKIISRDLLSKEKAIIYDIDKISIKTISWPKILFVTPFATPSVVIHSSLKDYLFYESIRYSEDYNLWKRITYSHVALKLDVPLTFTFKHDFISHKGTLSGNLRKMQQGNNSSFPRQLRQKTHALKINKLWN
jgi:hypothetical protein